MTQVQPQSCQGHVPRLWEHIVWTCIVYNDHASCQVTPCAEACQIPMGPPSLGVICGPRVSQDQRWLSEVQPHTSHHIYGAASMYLLSILCLPYQQHTNSWLLKEEPTAATMEVSYFSPLPLQENSFLFDCESLLEISLASDPASDAGYSSTGNSLSPTSSVDSFCFSPTSLLTFGSEQDPLDCLIFNTPAAPHLTHQTPLCSKSSSATKKSRSRYPGKKRQTASEREKLRMRDLTKALHHLRSYLPHSVAPAGQTLTKIEILRLTIRYISFLSAQLGLSEEVLEQKKSSNSVEHTQTFNNFLGQPAASYSPEEPSCNTMSKAQQPFLQNSYQVC